MEVRRKQKSKDRLERTPCLNQMAQLRKRNAIKINYIAPSKKEAKGSGFITLMKT